MNKQTNTPVVVTGATKAEPIPAPLNKTQSGLAEAASMNFFTFRNHVGKRLMTQTLPGEVQKQIIKILREQAKATGGDAMHHGDVRMIVDLFGSKQKLFKDMVIAPGAAIHTHSDINSDSLADNDPTRIIYVQRSLQFETESDDLIKARLDGVAEFAQNYDEYCEIGRRDCDYHFPMKVTYKGRSIRVSELLKYPSKREFIESFYAYRTPFRPLALFDKSRFAHLPAEFVERHANKANAAIIEQMEFVKDRALETVKISMDLISKQFESGQRLHESLVEKAQHAVRHLREIADGYNNSQMLRGLANTIEERILKATKSWESFKEDDKAKQAAARAAAAVSKKLGQIAKRPEVKPVAEPIVPATPAPAASKAAPSTGDRPAGSGILARKRRKAERESEEV